MTLQQTEREKRGVRKGDDGKEKKEGRQFSRGVCREAPG
jgi:hypothetical protein